MENDQSFLDQLPAYRKVKKEVYITGDEQFF